MDRKEQKALGLKNGPEKGGGRSAASKRRESALSKNGEETRGESASRTGQPETGGKKRRRGWKIILAVVIIAVAAVGLRFAVGPPILFADISAYEDEQILVTGLTEADFYVTPGELAELKLTKATATGNSQKAGTVTAIGPTLDTFLEAYGGGATRDDFKQVKFYASDDYTTALVQTLREKEIILSVANGREPLEEWQAPLRIVIPEEDSGKWIRLVNEIEFTWNDAEE